MKLKSEQSEENGRKDETELNQDDLTQIPQWMLDIQVLLTRSFLTNTREIDQRLHTQWGQAPESFILLCD